MLESKVSVKSLPAFLILYSPLIYIMAIVSSTQYGVGTDYFEYKLTYFDLDRVERFYNKSEYLFYYIFRLVRWSSLGDQAIFYISSIFNTLVIFITVYKLNKRYGYKIIVVFFIFFTVTNIFHNQMNGIRQYMALGLFPLILMYLYEKSYIRFLLLGLLAFFLHKTSLVFILFIPSFIFSRCSKRFQLWSFMIIPLLLMIGGSLFQALITEYLPMYRHYLTNEYGQKLPISSLFSKLYYIPVFIVFWFLYVNDKLESVGFGGLSRVLVSVWCITYWFLILYLDFGFMYRIAMYFVFFYIFPIYWVLIYFYKKGNTPCVLFFVMYLLLPYLLKVTLLAKGEFLYFNYIFN